MRVLTLLLWLAGAASAFAGQVPSPINAPASTTANDALAATANPQQAADSGKALPSGAIVGTTDVQTLTGKSIDGSEITSGTISSSRLPSTKSPLGWGDSAAQASNTTKFRGCVGAWTPGSGGQVLLPYAGTFKNLFVQLNASPGAGNTVTTTIMTGASPGTLTSTGITCQITGSATTCNDNAHSSAVTAGTNCAVQGVWSTSATSTSSWGGVEFDTP
jgi:hypothetical protein